MIDRRLLTNFDWVLFLTVLILASLGILNLYSATYSWSFPGTPIYFKQVAWLGMGIAISLGVCCFDYRHLEYKGSWLYALNILLLLYVLVAGKTSMGATRWISLGFFNLQPSELMKLVLIVTLARYLSLRAHPGGFSFRELTIPFALVGVAAVLVMKQPDLGTALLLIFISASMLLLAGIRRSTLFILSIGAVFCAIGGWRLLRPYQKQRILTFLDPEKDPLGSGYHIIQSKIAVGSGGFWGKGFMNGPQSQLSFLPERHTDFAFSVFAEEWGFTGSLVLLGIYFFLILWGLYIARRAADSFGMFLAVGVVAMLFWHIVVNLGMVIGLLPVVGVPLPLFSYGGTSMVTTMIGIGLLLNVSMRRFVF